MVRSNLCHHRTFTGRVKRELARSSPDRELRGRHAREQTRLSELERQLQKLRDARGHAETMDNPQRYHADAV